MVSPPFRISYALELPHRFMIRWSTRLKNVRRAPAAAGAMVTGAQATSSNAAGSSGRCYASYNVTRTWLNTTMIAQGVIDAPGDSRLACLHRRAQRRPITIAALGGSITTGVSYQAVADGKVSHSWLYHQRLARWLQTRWPEHQQEITSPNRTLNLGVPATGPAFFALCLPSLLARPPDLVLLEFGVNAQEAELDHFTALLRSMAEANVPTIVVSVRRYGSWSGCSVGSCKDPSELAVEPADSVATKLEDLARRHSTPVVSLPRALQGAIASAPRGSISAFMGDCRHPNSRGHNYLLQLLTHTIENAALSTMTAPLRCPARQDEWPESVLSRCGGSCLRGEHLKTAGIGAVGFEWVTGRKPGWMAPRAGGVLRVRVRVTDWFGAGDARVNDTASAPHHDGQTSKDLFPGASSTMASGEMQLGFVESWSNDYGRARIMCEPPCTCEARESLHGHSPRAKATITVLRKIEFQRPRAGDGSCVLRVVSATGGRGHGGRFMVSAIVVNQPLGREHGAVDSETLIRMEASLSYVEGDQLPVAPVGVRESVH